MQLDLQNVFCRLIDPDGEVDRVAAEGVPRHRFDRGPGDSAGDMNGRRAGDVVSTDAPRVVDLVQYPLNALIRIEEHRRVVVQARRRRLPVSRQEIGHVLVVANGDDFDRYVRAGQRDLRVGGGTIGPFGLTVRAAQRQGVTGVEVDVAVDGQPVVHRVDLPEARLGCVENVLCRGCWDWRWRWCRRGGRS